MRTRIIALILALILAIVGGVMLVGYVRGADQRAADGATLTSVLTVTQEVPAGTPANQLALFVEKRSIPEAFLADGAVTDLDGLAQLDGMVTTSTLVPGEQVIRGRLATPETFVNGGGSVQVPEGLQEISVSLEAPRLLGGRIAAGDRVGIFVSVDADASTPRQTSLLLGDVLVTAVSGGTATAAEGEGSALVAAPGSGTVTVTLAVSQRDAQAIIYSQQFGQLWFSKQNDSTTPGDGTAYTGQGSSG